MLTAIGDNRTNEGRETKPPKGCRFSSPLQLEGLRFPTPPVFNPLQDQEVSSEPPSRIGVRERSEGALATGSILGAREKARARGPSPPLPQGPKMTLASRVKILQEIRRAQPRTAAAAGGGGMQPSPSTFAMLLLGHPRPRPVCILRAATETGRGASCPGSFAVAIPPRQAWQKLPSAGAAGRRRRIPAAAAPFRHVQAPQACNELKPGNFALQRKSRHAAKQGLK